MKAKRELRAEWIKKNIEDIETARRSTERHTYCRGSCGNGATCKTQGGSGWGFWVQAFRSINARCDPMPYWSGKNPTPSTSISQGVADYIVANAPENIL